ncbi:helix-turn-helix transcriptional regulator [Actinomadura scrupuli]|uniref:helix-turn-helix transcriptional regulator n=1 Tax=Actinomadura scrupuli TaxID=559629 RepID=UPI003D95F2FF
MRTEKLRTNLPAEPNDFVGRERDVTDLCRLLATARAVTLCGPGGIGKTRLSLRVAAELAGDCPDGAWFVELGEVSRGGGPGTEPDTDPVTWRVAVTLGLAEEHGRGLQDVVVDALRARRMLIVLDNCEHLVEASARLCRLLLARCPGLRILATSREPLRVPGEHVRRVPPLTCPPVHGPAADPPAVPAHLLRHEAVRLFVVRAAAARPGYRLTAEDAAAVAQVCRELDGLPLAIELAAARIRVLSVRQIADRLADRFRLLGAGDRTAPSRHQTLRSAIDWSHDLLSVPEQVLLRRLSVFAGWTLDHAERVCPGAAADPLAPEDVLDLLTALVDKSLVAVDREVAGETRFRLPESIRGYAAERLAAAGEQEALRTRHRDHLLEAAEYEAEIAFARRPARWRTRVELFYRHDHELDNVRAAIGWCLERGDIEQGLRICTALRCYWIARGYYAEWNELTARLLDRAEGVSAGIRGAVLVGHAQFAMEQRDYERARECAAEGLTHARAGGDDAMVAAGLDVLAQTEVLAGRYREAAALLDEELAIARGTGDRWTEGLSLITRGSLLAQRERPGEAQRMYEAALRVFREIQQLWGVARTLVRLGRLAGSRGEPVAAQAYYEEALPILREIEAWPEIARCLAGIGQVALERGDVSGAREALTESLTLGRSIGMRLGLARGLEAFAALIEREGDGHRAVRLRGAAAALRETAGAGPVPTPRLERPPGPPPRGGPHARLWAEGLAMTAHDAVAYALETPAPSGPAGSPGPAASGAAVSGPGPSDPAASGAGTFKPAASGAAVPGSRCPAAPVASLTPRERQVAAMIARGLSNRGVADELVISPATVARHVTNILTKLGFTSRVQIAAWSIEHDRPGS